MSEETPKPKRKYTRKVKKAPVADPVEEAPIEAPIEALVSDTKKINISEEVFLPGYKTTAVYVYYQGYDIDTLQFIKSFQEVLSTKKIGSQIVICTKEKYERVGLRNCFHTEDIPKRWTDICLSREPICAVNIKERPRISPEELFEIIKENANYTDNFVDIIEY